MKLTYGLFLFSLYFFFFLGRHLDRFPISTEPSRSGVNVLFFSILFHIPPPIFFFAIQEVIPISDVDLNRDSSFNVFLVILAYIDLARSLGSFAAQRSSNRKRFKIIPYLACFYLAFFVGKQIRSTN